jgi:vacuolar protein sorting-associated protein 13A/C
MGIMGGATSLLTNTLSGTLNSISKITGSVGDGFVTLCFDDAYLEEREKLRSKRPKHLGDGLK